MKRLCAVLSLSLSLVPASIGAEAASWEAIEWFDGAAGYAEAVAQAETNGDDVLVYFYTDWCPYCRQLNQGLLSHPVVQAELGRMLAVRVNAEAGPEERSLAGHYRVRGYPALFLYTSAQGGQFTAIRRTIPDGAGAPRMKTADEFVESLRTQAR